MAEWHNSARGKQKMVEWRQSARGKQITVETKKRYRQTPEGKAKEQAYKLKYRERENELAKARAKLPHNLEKNATRQRERRAALIPRMHESHRETIAAIYASAKEQGLTVDHIVPLYGETVWGLHAPQNLQLLTRKDNSRKGTSYP